MFERMTRKSPQAVWTIVGIFLISRLIIPLFGVHMDYSALYKNWQYLDVTTLHTNIWAGVWFDHTQPPLFNLFLSAVLHLAGNSAETAFSLIFKIISLTNALLLLAILQRTVKHPTLPLIFTLIYLLSPASILFENELFYTSFISLLLLTSCYYLVTLSKNNSTKNTIGFLLPLVLVALTRSIYHIGLLVILSAIVIYFYRTRTLIISSLIALIIVGSWYVKNYRLFHSFSTSSWMGMNLARNVFHDNELKDSTRIETIEPFSNISAYKNFRNLQAEEKYRGLNDRDLLQEYKNDSFWNEKHIGYLHVSNAYMAACKQAIRSHPGAYLKNVLQSSIIFFAPATRYPPGEAQAAKLKYYDLLYSFNLSHFAHGKQQRRIALTLSALPKLLIYCLVFFLIIRRKNFTPVTLFISTIIAYIFFVGSFFEHYENMRFRYEAEPLFLILAAIVAEALLSKFNSRIKLPKNSLPERP